VRRTRWPITVCSFVLLASTVLSGCMAHRPYPYNRPSFHASLDRPSEAKVSRTKLARWNRDSERQLASAVANSPKELSLDDRW
jgi:hypothetical protein